MICDPQLIRGVAALAEALNVIGATTPEGDPMGDHAMAKAICDNEMELRQLLQFAMHWITIGD